jgi:type III pantothenate kinase
MTRGKLIAVDIGNSLTKVGWFDDAWVAGSAAQHDSAAQHGSAAQHDSAEASLSPAGTLPHPSAIRRFFTGQSLPEELFAELPVEPLRWRVASVNSQGQRIVTETVRARRPHDDLHILSRGDFPIDIRVDEPDRVGLDRLAAAVAANALRGREQAAIVVTAGTALVINVVGRGGTFDGGVILAGFRMQARSLFETADQLPLAEWRAGDAPPPVIGKNTVAAIQSGLFWGAVGAVREIVAQVARGLGHEPQVFVTGGDLARLAPLLGGQVRFVPNMVLAGIALAARAT